MASFVLTSFSSTPRVLIGAETGFLTNRDAELVVTGDHAITSSGAFANVLTLNGLVAANDTVSWNAVEASGSGLRAIVGATGTIISASGDGFSASVGGLFDLINVGSIIVASDGVTVAHSDGDALITVSNSGTIHAGSDGISVDSGSQIARIVNSGSITAATGVAVSTGWMGGTGTTTLVNTGMITGFTGSFEAGSGAAINVINNAGLMAGQILLGLGDDLYEGGSGQVTGTVFGENGADTLAGGEFTDVLDGGSGDDHLVGRGGDDVMTSGSGADVLLGGSGNDQMTGGTEADTLIGNSGDDTMAGDGGDDLLIGQDGTDSIDGGDGSDTLDGGAGDDVLEGGGESDVLRGRGGEDELAGGLGLDFLTGGSGADIFVFRTTTHAGLGATRDQILDFEQGLDLINVVSMSTGVFEFIGTAAFSAVNQIRVIETANGSSIVQFNTDADLAAEAEIRVAGVTGLTADDFAL